MIATKTRLGTWVGRLDLRYQPTRSAPVRLEAVAYAFAGLSAVLEASDHAVTPRYEGAPSSVAELLGAWSYVEHGEGTARDELVLSVGAQEVIERAAYGEKLLHPATPMGPPAIPQGPMRRLTPRVQRMSIASPMEIVISIALESAMAITAFVVAAKAYRALGPQVRGIRVDHAEAEAAIASFGADVAEHRLREARALRDIDKLAVSPEDSGREELELTALNAELVESE
jgi:hypothetical protein